ncbi:MAG: PrsW family intramembrane metalloprotease [Victivallales bacterium]|nr:PrsW family intramembrane metalloprotease [Victivallales bacterium]
MNRQEDKVHFSIGEMFEQAFTNHTEDEMEQYWGMGAPGNIPAIENLPKEGPRPWMFARILGLSAVVFLTLLYFGCKFPNAKFLPGLIIIGSMAMPFSIMVLFFELNARRNVSMYMTIKMFFLGGVLSLLLIMVNVIVINLFEVKIARMGDIGVSLIEETAMLLVIICLLGNRRRFPYILNGLLFGAAVGAGFGLFDTASHTMWTLVRQLIIQCINNGDGLKNIFIQSQKELGEMALENQLELLLRTATRADDAAMIRMLGLRALLPPAGHVIWAALNAAALWRVKGGNPFKIGHLFDIRFSSIFICTTCFHIAWNSEWTLNILTSKDKYIIIGFLGWSLVFWMIRKGLQQVHTAREISDGHGGTEQYNGEQALTHVIQNQAEYVRNLTRARINMAPYSSDEEIPDWRKFTNNQKR